MNALIAGWQKNFPITKSKQFRKWAGVKNGNLMRLAEIKFDVFITVDRNLSFQENLPEFNIAVLVLKAKSNRLADLQPFTAKIIEVLPTLGKGKAEMLSLEN